MIRKCRQSLLRRSVLSLQSLEDRSVPSSVQGTIFEDANHNQLFDPGEQALSGWTVYIDNNRDGIMNPAEVFAVSDVNGKYFIDTTSVPTNSDGRNYVALDLQVGSGGRWINDTAGTVNINPISEPGAVRDFGVHLQPYVSVEPNGSESLINVTTSNSQYYPSVAANASGNYVIAWNTSITGSNAIMVREFSVDGTPLTGEITVASGTTSGTLSWPKVDIADNGLFAVAWSTNLAAYGTSSASLRIYNANASPATGVITVAAGSKNSNNIMDGVAMDAVGNLAVLYRSWKPSVASQSHLIQRFTPTGSTVGKAINVATTAVWLNATESILMDSSGRFVAVWDEISTGTLVLAQRYSATGQPVGSRITVAAAPADIHTLLNANSSMNATGRFVVTWSQYYFGINNAQVYDWGTPVGTTLTLDSPPGTGAQYVGSDVDAANNVTFAYAMRVGNSSSIEIGFQRFTAAGDLEPLLLANTTTQGAQGNAVVAATGANKFVVAWDAYGPGDDQGIFSQRFAIPTPPPPLWSGGSTNGSSPTPSVTPSRSALGTGASIFDFDNGGQTSALDFVQFGLRYGVSLLP